ncbi:MAG TPA: hypothetical protein PKZ32_18105 [Candidatus Melainabacteria bacterium]|nr:hypothetical protein [Candidatus Melainabacteria bacterium]
MAESVARDARKFTWLPKLEFLNPFGYEMQFIILGGMAFYLPIILFLGELGLRKETVLWNFWINTLATAPHTSATYVRLQRKIKEGKVHWSFGWPAFLATWAILIGFWAAGHFILGITIAAMWQSFHYLRQMYGVNRIFSGKNEESELARKLNFWAYHLAVPLFVFGRSDMLWHVWNGKPSDTFAPMNVPDLVMVAFAFIAYIGFLLGLISEYLKAKKNSVYNPVGLLMLLLYFAVHYYGFLSVEYYVRGFLFISIYHAIQYVAMVYYLERDGRTEKLTEKLMKGPLLLAFPVFWLLLIAFGYLVNQGAKSADMLWTQFSLIVLNNWSVHHYVVDTVLWTRKTGK